MVSDKNTKQEILDEYRNLLADIKVKGLTIPQSAKGLNSKNNKTDILNAIKQILDVINNSKTNIKVQSETSIPAPTQKIEIVVNSKPKKEDNDLSYLNKEITEKIHALESAKSLKKSEYNNILTIEQELIKFVAMINQNKNNGLLQIENQKVLKAQQEENITQLTTNADYVNQTRLDEANEKLLKIEESIKNDKEKLTKYREIEEEAYSYKTTISQKEEDDIWSDDVIRRESIIAEVEKEITTLQATIDSKSTLVSELKAKIDEIPTLVEQAKIEGSTAKEKELGKEYGYKTTMAKKEAEATIQALTKQIENLKEDYNNVYIEKQSIQEKLDKAYEDSNKLYMQTVQSTGGVKILNNSDKN